MQVPFQADRRYYYQLMTVILHMSKANVRYSNSFLSDVRASLTLTNVLNSQAGVIQLYQLTELIDGLLSVFGGLKKGASWW